MRILVLTRSYPAADDLYQYPFVHRRALAYEAAGHDVAVFRPARSARLSSHEYEGITCFSGNEDAFKVLTDGFHPDVIAAHGFDEQMHQILEALAYRIPVCAWLHGSEIPGFFRAKALALNDLAMRDQQLAAVERRAQFWRDFLPSIPERFQLVFVSQSAVNLALEDLGSLPHGGYHVIPNPIDTTLFRYRPKSPSDRLRILMIRPFDSRSYGNDLAVSAILGMANLSEFDRLTFTIVGDGPLFDETIAPLAGYSNVRIERRFLTQPEIAQYHELHGIFLVPTRLDTQGVSRDEAMSSGLVPVTNYVSAVPEFVDDSCAGLADAEDAAGLANSILQMVAEPRLFLARSENASRRVRSQSGHEIVIPAELQLLSEIANG